MATVIRRLTPILLPTEVFIRISTLHRLHFHQVLSSYSGYFNGILEFDVSGAGNSQFASMEQAVPEQALLLIMVPTDDVKWWRQWISLHLPSNNYTSNWTTVDTGSMTLTFGDA